MTDAIHRPNGSTPTVVDVGTTAATSSAASPPLPSTKTDGFARAQSSSHTPPTIAEMPTAESLGATAKIGAALQATAALAASVPPILSDWTGPYGGVPPFDKIKLEEFEPAFATAMSEARREIDAIAKNPEAPTFENTMVALERSGRMLGRVSAIFDVWSANLSSQAFEQIEQRIAPMRAAFDDEVVQNEGLWKRIAALNSDASSSSLTPEQKRLVDVYYRRFAKNGAMLDPQTKARVSQLTQRLATSSTTFSQHQLADERKGLTITRIEDLAGLPPELVQSAAEEAERRGQKGQWVIANKRSAMEPFLASATNRALRESAFRMWTLRGDNGDVNDNNALASEILTLRAERAKLFGYPTHAHWRLSDTMAKEPAKTLELMMQLWKPAVDRVKTEVAEMQAIVDAEGGGFAIQPWDYRYYAEKVRKAKYDIDLNEVKSYLQVDNLVKAMFASANKLYGLTFHAVTDVPVFHPEVTVYEVRDRGGKRVGLWYFDPFAREGKNSGAWMTAYREQHRVDGDFTTIVSNNSNFIKGKPGEPVTVSWDDANTMFHEFGHALHGLLSNVTYPSLSGTNTARDFVEFPSQFNEHYLTTAEVMRFLVDKDGRQMPSALIEKLERARFFNKGFETVELLASAIVDMKLHLAGDAKIDTKVFEKATLDELGMPPQIVMRHRIPHFGHIFASDGYSAGYYSYVWSDALNHDAYEAFTEAGDPYHPAIAKRMVDTVLSVGNTVDPSQAFRNFRGRDVTIDALLRARGFPVARP